MSNVRFQVRVSYVVAMEYENLDNKEVVNALKNIDSDIIDMAYLNSDEQNIVSEFFISEFSERDAIEVEYEIEQLEVDNEEIF